jgi:hypothetical protein
MEIQNLPSKSTTELTSRVDETDQPALSCLGRVIGQCVANEMRKPIAALSQSVEQTEQTNVRHIDKPDSARPSRRAPQTSITQAISQNHAQEIDGVFNYASAQNAFVPRALDSRFAVPPSRLTMCFQSQLASDSWVIHRWNHKPIQASQPLF